MNEMMEMIKAFDSKPLPIRHIPGPEGVRGRNSDNALILEKLGWEPTIRLNDGLHLTYDWIKLQLSKASRRFASGNDHVTCAMKAPYAGFYYCKHVVLCVSSSMSARLFSSSCQGKARMGSTPQSARLALF